MGLSIPTIAFEGWELMPGWCTLDKRAGTLGGSQLMIHAAVTVKRSRVAVRFGLDDRSSHDAAIALDGKRILIWSGVMVKPTPGLALWVTRTFNRHCRVGVVEHLIDDPTAYTPLAGQPSSMGFGWARPGACAASSTPVPRRGDGLRV